MHSSHFLQGHTTTVVLLYWLKKLMILCNPCEVQNPSSITSPIVLVVNKIDCALSSREWVDMVSGSFNRHVFTCAVTGEGISDLESAISELVGLDKIPAGGCKWTVNQVSTCLLLRFDSQFYFTYIVTSGVTKDIE